MSLFNWGKKASKEPVFISNPSQMLVTYLLFDEEPIFNDSLLDEQISKNFIHFKPSKLDNRNDARQYFLEDYPVVFKEGSIAAQCTMFKSSLSEEVQKLITVGLRQAWHWPDAESSIKKCTHQIIINDLMTQPLPYKTRVELFQKFICSIALALKPKGIYFRTSEKIIEPSAYIRNVQMPDGDFLHGLLNVRLFNIEGKGMLMDTLGLHAMGLPDFQIKYSKQDPGQLAGLLRSYSHYIYDSGSVIANGNTVEGVQEGSKWKCIYEDALIEPNRSVIDIKE